MITTEQGGVTTGRTCTLMASGKTELMLKSTPRAAQAARSRSGIVAAMCSSRQPTETRSIARPRTRTRGSEGTTPSRGRHLFRSYHPMHAEQRLGVVGGG